MSREIYGLTVGEPVTWKSGCIEEDSKEDSEKKNNRRRSSNLYTGTWREGQEKVERLSAKGATELKVQNLGDEHAGDETITRRRRGRNKKYYCASCHTLDAG